MSLPPLLRNRLRLPVIASPMFILSNPALVIAQCTSGVVGSFPSLNARPLSQLDEWLAQITEGLAQWDRDHPDTPAAPFAVNQIVHKSNGRLDQDLQLCAKYKVPIIISSLGARVEVNEAVHGWGGIALHDVIDDRFGRKAIEKGADGLIAVATGAGGHAGRLSPFALVQELRQWFDGPIALSGSIATGGAILAAQAMGADLAYIGSLFIASQEANAVAAYKQMVVDGRASDIVYSNVFTGVHGNYLKPSIAAAGLDPDSLPQGDANAANYVFGEANDIKAWRDIWGCGQGLGVIDMVQPAAGHIERLSREYAAARAALNGKFVPQQAPDAPMVSSGTRVRTHAEIRRRASQAAQGFLFEGIREGDCVALLLRNDFVFFEAMLATVMAGAYPVPINWHATREEAAHLLEDCGARILIVHADLLPGVPAHLADKLKLLVVETPAEIRSAYGLKAGLADDRPRENWYGWSNRFAAIADPATSARGAVIYTSGTTGRPKGVRRRAGEPQRAMMATGSIVYDLAEPMSRTVLMNGPMYHSAPNGYAMLALESGADVILQPRFDPEELLHLIEHHAVTHMHIVPTMFVRLLRLPEAVRRRYDLSSLRRVIHGAAPCPPGVKQSMIDWWGPVIHEYYGATEIGLATAISADEARTRPGSVGRALPGVSVRILDEEGHVLPPGSIGAVFVKTLAGEGFDYIGMVRDRRSDGFVTAGDIGYLDEDGYLFLCDRRNNMIISGGVNIYPAEIEAALLAIEGVRDGAVFGIPDEEYGEAVCAHVQVDQNGPDPAQIRDALAGKLSRFKIPKVVKIVDDLPREDSGKIFTRKLRAPYWAATGRSI